ncbi:CHASE2 domain-containing protein [Trichocoleus sp. DQ-A3]|nr:CHASE2 domain-containing protein [Coleofasciculus sp. FACHB-125]MBD1899437.1 CHASE2 domain-containing protein [Coleofasciculus sp. FACHB-125]
MWITLKQQLWRWRGVLITVPSVAGGLLILRLVGTLQLMELVALDQMFRLRPSEPTDPRIVLVTVDESDIKELGQWPMSDEVLARLILSLKQQQPKLIGLDIFRDLPVEPGHQELVNVFTSTPNLIGIEKVIKTAEGQVIDAPPVLKQRDRSSASDLLLDTDGRVRRSLVYLRTPDNQSIFTLGARLAFAYLEGKGISRQPINREQMQFRLGRATFTPLQSNDGGYVDVDARGYQILSNFPKFQKGFRTISITDVLQGRMPRDFVRDRIVLIGITAESVENRFFTSYTTNSIAAPSGVEVHALLTSQLLSAALDERPLLRTWSEPLEWLWIVLWSTIGTLIGWTSPSPRRTASRVVLLGIALLGSAYVLFLIGWWLIIIPPLFALVASAITSNGYLLWENLKDYARTLEQKVEERTLKLQQEIVERKQAELALVESEARFRQLAGATVEAIAITEQGKIIDANEAFIQMFGYLLFETVGMRASNLVSPDSREIVVQNMQSGYEGSYETVGLRKDGTTFPAEIRAKVTTYGERVVRIASIRDISDRKRAEQASILEERNRMAREIHDTLAQAFTGILLHIGSVTQMLANNSGSAQIYLERLEKINELARTGLAEARRSVVALRPQLLEESTLQSALHRLVTQMRSTTKTTLIYESKGVIYSLPTEVENHLLRIGQEALTNAIKYANASKILVELVYDDAQCLLRIKDDGQGFGVGSISSLSGFGLLGMSERAERIDAHLAIQSQPGQGTEIVVIVNRE